MRKVVWKEVHLLLRATQLELFKSSDMLVSHGVIEFEDLINIEVKESKATADASGESEDSGEVETKKSWDLLVEYRFKTGGATYQNATWELRAAERSIADAWQIAFEHNKTLFTPTPTPHDT